MLAGISGAPKKKKREKKLEKLVEWTCGNTLGSRCGATKIRRERQENCKFVILLLIGF